jgi:serine/threonine protein kinase
VWLAEKRSVFATTQVALKMPNDEDVDLNAVKREASLWEKASGHPNILPIIEADIYGEQIVIVSEYASDGSLSKWLSGYGGKAPDVESAIEMIGGILAGLEHLHKRGIIHRDLKPDNILLQGETPRLADFGIARILKTISKSTSATGTPAYMSPEAFDGKRSEQADIWSVGVIFYQLLKGQLPFPQTDAHSLLMAIVTREPEPLPNSIPSSLQKVVQTALQKSPAERYESAGEMRKALRVAFQAQPISYGEAKTKVFVAPPAALLPTVSGNNPSMQSEEATATVASPDTVAPTEKSLLRQPSLAAFSPIQSVAEHDVSGRRPNRMRWIVGVIVAVLVGTIIIIFILNRNSSSPASPPAPSPDEAFEQGIAAHVNGKPITLSKIDKIINQQFQGEAKTLAPTELATVRLQVLDNIINKEVLFQRAEREGLLPTEDEVTQLINSLKTEAGTTEAEFQQRLKEQGETLHSLREEAIRELAVKKLQDKETSNLTVEEREIVDYYNNNKTHYVTQRGVGLSFISVDAEDSGNPNDAKSDTEAKQKIDTIYLQLRSGADFATVARTQSEDSVTNLHGGDAGFATEKDLKQTGFPPELTKQFFGPMQVGDITHPIRFNGRRWYIFKLTLKRLQPENLTLDSPGIRSQIMEALINQKKQIVIGGLIQTAKNESKIINYLASKIKLQ